MRNRIKNLSALYKLLISYIAVLLFPLILVFLFFYPKTTEAITQKEIEASMHMTEQVKNSIDIQIESISYIPTELFNNMILKQYSLNENYYNKVVAIDEIRKYVSVNKFISSIILYIRNTGFLYSELSMQNISDFGQAGFSYRYKNWDHDSIVRDLNTIKKPAVRPAEEAYIPGGHSKRLITFLSPLPNGISNPYGTVITIVDADEMQTLMKSNVKSGAGNIIVMDGSKQVITALKEAEYLKSGQLAKVIGSFEDSATRQVEIGGRIYIVSVSKSVKTGWSYISMIPMSDVLEDINQIKLVTLILFVLILILESIIIAISMRSNYKPLRALADATRRNDKGMEQRYTNEFEAIRSALKNLSEENTTLDERIRGTKPVLVEYILFGLINGGYISDEQFYEETRELGLELNLAVYSITIFKVLQSSRGSYKNDLKIFDMYGKNLPSGLNGYFITRLYKDSAIFVSSQRNMEELKQYLVSLNTELETNLGLNTMVCMGGQVSSVTEVNNSYLQALSVLEYMDMKQLTGLVSYTDLPVRNHGFKSYPAEDLYLLEFALHKNDSAMIVATIGRLMNLIENGEIPPYLVRVIYHDIMRILSKGCKKMNDEENTVENSNGLVNEIKHFSIEEMLKKICEKRDELISLVESGAASEKKLAIEDVVRYIDNKYMDYDFSIQSVSDYYGMTVSNFSHYFKKYTDKNFKDYVDYLRINKAKRLLENKDRSIESIAADIGYSSASNFTRAFKKNTGVTPGVFRQENSKQ